ncbi:hypothetical protein HAX54_027269 [Datura stramonium]|uniref:Uncharacterized protein n=1 Tax=Datura stramonium TaxID=4076 RepID=A0ABS8V4T3_DATST|nr:hypothetical protein [Datura stramonium]
MELLKFLSRGELFEDHMKGTLSMEGCYVNERDVDKMLHYCCKYTKSTAEELMNDPTIYNLNKMKCGTLHKCWLGLVSLRSSPSSLVIHGAD